MDQHNEEDAKNCCEYKKWKNERKLPIVTRCWGRYKYFENENIQRYYEYFLINGVSKFQIVFWFLLLLLYSLDIAEALLEGRFGAMASEAIICIVLRFAIIMLAFFNYSKIFGVGLSHEVNMAELHNYVNSVMAMSNFIIVSFAAVNGVDYVLKSTLRSCLENGEGEFKPSLYPFHHDCNPEYETGGLPMNATIYLFVGNLLAVSSLRCHNSWSAQVNYLVTIICIVIAAFMIPEYQEAFPVIFAFILMFSVYESIDHNSLAMFSALLDLESTKRIQTSELKHFIGNVAHDLKTPLHGFSMCLDHLLLDSRAHQPEVNGEDSMAHTIELCQANCSFMATAINRTVDFTKSASNIALNPKMETTSVMHAMQWAVNCLTNTQTRIPIEIEPLDEAICTYVVTDKHWLMENMLCYLSNAVKYSSGGIISIGASLQDDECDVNESIRLPVSRGIRDTFSILKSRSTVDVIDVGLQDPGTPEVTSVLCISVEDEGIGIDNDKKSSLFQPFQQTMRLAGGTGLGLYSLAKRVEALRGKYGVTGRSDGRPGSRFWFTVPYKPCIDHFADVSSEPSREIPRLHHKLSASWDIKGADSVDSYISESSSLSALVVEDSLVISKATKRMLTKAGYDVDVAENGAVGLKKMIKKVYSIVVMDLQMPIMDGLEAARRIRSIERESSYIASGKRKQLIFGVSANGADDIRKEALASGMNAFVPKPFSIDYIMQYQVAELRDFDEFSV